MKNEKQVKKIEELVKSARQDLLLIQGSKIDSMTKKAEYLNIKREFLQRITERILNTLQQITELAENEEEDDLKHPSYYEGISFEDSIAPNAKEVTDLFSGIFFDLQNGKVVRYLDEKTGNIEYRYLSDLTDLGFYSEPHPLARIQEMLKEEVSRIKEIEKLIQEYLPYANDEVKETYEIAFDQSYQRLLQTIVEGYQESLGDIDPTLLERLV